MRQIRAFVFSLLVIASCAIVAGNFGPGASALAESSAAPASADDELSAGLKTFTSIYRLVEENAADKVNPDKAIYKGAVPGMLRTLDPHSSFFDPRDFQQLREDQRGSYYGVGMTIQPKDSRIVVVAPFTGSPAYKAGIRPGDVIVEVNDKRTDGMNTSEVADLLKGPKGTKVQVLIAREGVDKPITFNLVRGEIPRFSVQNAFWLKPGIAYIDVESFNENTSKELEDAMHKLGESNIKGLVFDLRDNPGGLLNEGVAVAGHFLRKGQTVVSHRGRSSPERPYTASNGSSARDYPIVVMVNRYSASAAEIVAGALQDHDRAWIFGDNTFGKGLVQTVFPLSENTGLALTTAKYYTPSGRLIQRDYTSGSFYEYYFNRKDGAQKDSTDVKMTDAGRAVYGGNGITPDEKFVIKYNKFQIELARRSAFRDFLPKYFSSHSTTLAKDWTPDNAMLNEFHDYALKNNAQFTEAEWAENNDWIKTQLKREALITAVSLDESLRYAIETDPAVLKAMDSLPKAKALLLDNSKKQMVQLDKRARRD
ncbi:MAG: PDZ domain-containing protein [Acidobacteria bacterium]|nr:PDZ domain-containing protein [Acidobacteriota bacterium]